MKHIYVLTGNFGSGKTELALNLAFNSAGRGGKTLLIDLDMVNTYFRATERKTAVEASRIKLISPNYASTGVESLSLPAEVSTAFHADWDTVIFDVGGDGAGASALGRYLPDFKKLAPEQLEVLNVVNIRRPLSATAEKIIALSREITGRSRLPLTGFVNNTNLAAETTADELSDGYEVLKSAVDQTGIPVKYTTGRQNMLDVFLQTPREEKYTGTPLAITPYMRRDWRSFTRSGL